MDRDHLLIVDVDAGSRGYAGARLLALGTELRSRIALVPGVRAVSFNENGIFTGTESATNIGVPGYEIRQRSDSVSYYDQIGPAFVASIGGRLLHGRDLTEADREGSPAVLLINESFARYYFGDVSPLGRTIRVGDSLQAEIVGVLADIKDHELVGAARRRFYLPYLQQALGEAGLFRLVVRTNGEPIQSMASVRRAMNEVVADLPIREASPLSRLMRDSIREERLMARLATLFGAAALLLAAVGLYGVLSYAVSRRAGEIGLRVALGAQRGAVIRMILRDALVLVAMGIAIGIPLTLGASRIIRSQLHGVGPADPLAFLVALGVLASGALGAALLPALRASRVAPLVALRAE